MNDEDALYCAAVRNLINTPSEHIGNLLKKLSKSQTRSHGEPCGYEELMSEPSDIRLNQLDLSIIASMYTVCRNNMAKAKLDADRIIKFEASKN